MPGCIAGSPQSAVMESSELEFAAVDFVHLPGTGLAFIGVIGTGISRI